jgi:hypothetical protein
MFKAFVFLAMLAGMGLAGCVSTDARSADIKVTISPSAPAYVLVAAARQTPRETVIDGEAALPMTSRSFGFTGGVDARIDLPNGQTFEIRGVRVIPRARPRKLGGEAYFTIHTGRRLSPGTRISLIYRN